MSTSNTVEKKEKRRCFIITPIGGETDPIRRHIDGIINAAIRPALEDDYIIEVAHRISEPGTITKQIINEIYNDELVVANLTNNNPNVMYELAFRHSLGKPVIIIAEKGTALPSDIIMERTIFYQNDAQGIIDLRKDLKNAEAAINFDKVSSPIHSILQEMYQDAKIVELSRSDKDAETNVLEHILNRLNSIESTVQTSRLSPNINSRNPGLIYSARFRCSISPDSKKGFNPEVVEQIGSILHEECFANSSEIEIDKDERTIIIRMNFIKPMKEILWLESFLVDFIKSLGIDIIKSRVYPFY